MKYIRLGNDIYQIIKEKEGYFELRDALDVKMKCYTFMPKREQDYKIADTIEELCDEFVIIRKDDNTFALAKYYPDDKTFYVKTADEEVSLNECLMYEYEIYGAIWTDKGLIYVAKMNEKGELELI